MTDTTAAIVILADGKDIDALLETVESVLSQTYPVTAYLADFGEESLPEDLIEAVSRDGIRYARHGGMFKMQIAEHYFLTEKSDTLQFIESGDTADPDKTKACVEAYDLYYAENKKKCSFVYTDAFLPGEAAGTVTDLIPEEERAAEPKIYHFLKDDITGSLSAVMFDRASVSGCFYGPTYGRASSMYQVLLRSFRLSNPVYIGGKFCTVRERVRYPDDAYRDIWEEFKNDCCLYPSTGLKTASGALRSYAASRNIKDTVKTALYLVYFAAGAMISGTSGALSAKAPEIKSAYSEVKKKTGLSKILGE